MACRRLFRYVARPFQFEGPPVLGVAGLKGCRRRRLRDGPLKAGESLAPNFNGGAHAAMAAPSEG